MRNVVLIGFMGTGKSAVGQILARRLGWTFVDIDRRAARRERATVPQILARHGEGYFRDVEARIIAEVAGRRDLVIATGAGVVLRPENMRRLRANGWIVSLTAPVDVLLTRLGERRPSLGGDARGEVVRLLDQRRPLYRDADLMIDVSVATPDRVADAVLAFLGRRDRRTVPVHLSGRDYPVHIGEGILPLLPVDLAALGAGRRVAVVTHRSVRRSAAGALLGVLRSQGFEVSVFDVPAGEGSKSLVMVGALCTRLARARVDRHSTLLAVGGGVVGDLGGFVAATYMRGIRLVHVPTTLLAMVDSSIGGKTGVNHAGVKNLVGAFYQPSAVVADVRTLQTLPERELRSGLAEVVKTAVVGDADLFEFLEDNLAAVLRREPDALIEVISRCAAFKARVVEADEAERAERQILNYGHTLGHAVEAAAGFRGLTHGEAVAIGMALEARLAQRLGLTSAATVERQNALLARIGLPVRLGPVSRAAVWRALALDKKSKDGVLRWPMLVGIGSVRREQEVPEALLREVIGGSR
ncbi:MAG: 3-dehydroquinate synthase [Armatimonadota bacterium]|nr:3-dehydroquinate synthase [Armatimonadota bacterium]MDR7451051.1 3-dehydroquinate synthase [Armatimonadota bacterium]MDR7465928.1 3-dehydroquinate synthase [Armatimonadota bacterium]MDR7493993.1 3-dehydroquinate synthase [Armatimonadota bacterium]MDR7498443.1 3-dehydroquinate synthase [Armatimonadota bacterium]